MYYLAGPYSIDPERMYERHIDAADRLFSAGHVVYSPIAETHDWHKRFPHDYRWWLSRDVEILARCDGLIRLPGDSPGSDFEVDHARAYGIPVWLGQSPVDDFIEGKPPTIAKRVAAPQKTNQDLGSILDEAEDLTGGDRNVDYGHPADDFAKVVGAVNSFFAHKLKEPFEITDWPLIMQCVKIAREVNKPKRDNRVDGAGYWNCLQMIHDRAAANG